MLQCDTFDADVGDRWKIKVNQEGTIPQESIRRLKQLLPLAASNLLISCFETFCKTCRKHSNSVSLETSVTPSGSCDEVMENVGREHKICFTILDCGHYYFGLAVHSLKNIIYDWPGDIYSCCTLFFSSLYEYFKHFQSLSRRDAIYKSDEDFRSLHSNQQTSILMMM